MPRYIKSATSKKRQATPDSTRLQRQYKWTDPFPEVHGTLPEKMVYAELTRLGIPFYFLNDVHAVIPEIEFDQWYQADFIIPSIKLIIEVQGAFWHSKDKTIESDAYKFAIYETIGYRVLAWWDYDIISRLQDLVFADAQLLSIARPGGVVNSAELTPLRRTKVDTSKGIRTLNSRRRVEAAPQTSRRKIRKGITVYAATK